MKRPTPSRVKASVLNWSAAAAAAACAACSCGESAGADMMSGQVGKWVPRWRQQSTVLIYRHPEDNPGTHFCFAIHRNALAADGLAVPCRRPK